MIDAAQYSLQKITDLLISKGIISLADILTFSLRSLLYERRYVPQIKSHLPRIRNSFRS